MKKELRDRPKSARIKLSHKIQVKEGQSLLTTAIINSVQLDVLIDVIRVFGFRHSSNFKTPYDYICADYAA